VSPSRANGAAAQVVAQDEVAVMPGGVLPLGTADAALRYMFPEPAPYLGDPVLWVKERAGGFVWSKQIEILESVRDNKYTAVKACHGPGKSASAGLACGWWIDVHDFGSAFVVTTAPSWPQVQAILWREIRRLHARAKLPGRITQDCVWHMSSVENSKADEEFVAMGRKPADYDEQAFQGIHARYILIVIDEACGVPEALWTAVLSLATNENARVLAIGNPDDPSSYFATVCKPGSGWNVITISAFDTPNFTGEPIPEWLQQDLVHPDWVAERAADWGEESPVYVSKVLGEFPDVSDEYLITPALMERAYGTHLVGLGHGRYGADIARMGRDKTVLYRNRDGVIRFIDSWSKMDTMKTVGKLRQHLDHYPTKIPATIDSIGVGAGVVDRLRELGLEAIGFQGSERAYRPEKFKNRRAEVYWEFRQALEDGVYDLDPEDTKLAAELCNIKYWIDSGGRIVVESKEDMRERGVPSPDHADAAVYSTIHRSVPVNQAEPQGERGLVDDLLSKVM
jgi:hypothetical protein